jgi:hypothetical protein
LVNNTRKWKGRNTSKIEIGEMRKKKKKESRLKD